MIDVAELVGIMFSGLSALFIDDVVDAGEAIVVRARTRDGAVACPGCGTETARVHGYHERTAADVPVDGRRVVVKVRARRMRCPALDCRVQTFREQVSGVLERYQRRISRLTAQVSAVARELAGRASARLLPALGIAASRHTMLRVLLRIPLPALAVPRVLGIDDFALRRGRVYATVLIDAETGRRVDVAEGRTAGVAQKWLLDHPGAEVVCRDGSGAYGEAALHVRARWCPGQRAAHGGLPAGREDAHPGTAGEPPLRTKGPVRHRRRGAVVAHRQPGSRRKLLEVVHAMPAPRGAERTPPPAQPRAVPGMASAAVPSPVAREAGLGSWPTDAVFAMPAGPPLRLPVPPRLASWNGAGDPDQVRLAGYLDVVEALLRPSLEQLSGPLALRLDVGLPSSASLLSQRDLDNYLLPLAARLSRAGAGTLACVWGTKQHAGDSMVRLERGAPATAAPPSGSCYTVRTTAPGQSNAFKEQIREQLSSASTIPPGPVRMQLCFTVGPARNWLNLWKPAIDAMGQILGHAPAADPWSPLDGRIVDLGLHCLVNPSIGGDVIIAIAATRA